MKNGLAFMGMGFELLGLIMGGLYIGQFIDQKMGWPGYGVAIVVVSCMVSWVVHLIYLLKRYMREVPNDSNSK